MRLVLLAFAMSLTVSAQACATRSGGDDAPIAATFRRGQSIEFYDFRLNISHAGASGVAARDCSSDDFHCYAGVSLLIAPRDCSRLRRLVRSRADWRVNDAVAARFLFLSETQLYYASDAAGAAGFVYDIERGVVGVWSSPAATRGSLDRPAIEEIVTSTRWLEAPRTLFACR